MRCTKETFVKKARAVHGNKYNYDLSEFTIGFNKIIITCPKHGNFKQQAKAHLYDDGCPDCNASKGEQLVENKLRALNIKFVKQKKFVGCYYKNLLPFDFYMKHNNTCIEFDGPQHFKPIDHFGGEKQFKIQQRNDKIKNKFCKKNNIRLIRLNKQTVKTFHFKSLI